MAPSDQDLLDLTVKTDCYKQLDDTEHRKVDLAMQGKPASTPRSNIAKVAFYLARRLHPVQTEPPPPPPPPPQEQPWDSGYPPRAYNMGSRGQNCIFNVHINCTQRSDGKYVDQHGLVYSDSGLCDGGRSETPDIPGLKASDMKDQKEPWESYEWMGNVIGPNKENYPPESYLR